MPPKPRPTHFLCVPLVTTTSRPQLAWSLGSFRADVAGLNGYGLPPDAVRPVGTLHLTLGVMCFPGGAGIDRATEVLRALEPRALLAGVFPASSKAAAPAEATVCAYFVALVRFPGNK